MVVLSYRLDYTINPYDLSGGDRQLTPPQLPAPKIAFKISPLSALRKN